MALGSGAGWRREGAGTFVAAEVDRAERNWVRWPRRMSRNVREELTMLFLIPETPQDT